MMFFDSICMYFHLNWVLTDALFIVGRQSFLRSFIIKYRAENDPLQGGEKIILAP